MTHDDYDFLNFKVDDFVFMGEFFNKKYKKQIRETEAQKEKDSNNMKI